MTANGTETNTYSRWIHTTNRHFYFELLFLLFCRSTCALMIVRFCCCCCHLLFLCFVCLWFAWPQLCFCSSERFIVRLACIVILFVFCIIFSNVVAAAATLVIFCVNYFPTICLLVILWCQLCSFFAFYVHNAYAVGEKILNRTLVRVANKMLCLAKSYDLLDQHSATHNVKCVHTCTHSLSFSLFRWIGKL